MSASNVPSPVPAREVAPRWPARLRESQSILRSPTGSAVRQNALETGWLLVHSALFRYLTMHASRMGSVDLSDLEDLASEKSLDLARKLESGVWDLGGRDDGEIAGFLSTVARNGLIDWMRKAGRSVPTEETDDLPSAPSRGEEVGPEVRMERTAFARALTDCAGELSTRDRLVWIFRVFYELRSREIASHPDVGLKASHVDVILQRCREAVRDCMSRKGHDLTHVPPGTFSELWSRFRLSRDPGPGRPT